MTVSRALARVGMRRTAQSARRKDCRLHVAVRAGRTPQDVPRARRKTCRVSARRADFVPRLRAGDAPDARHVRARARPFLLFGGGRRIEAVVVRRRPGGG